MESIKSSHKKRKNPQRKPKNVDISSMVFIVALSLVFSQNSLYVLQVYPRNEKTPNYTCRVTATSLIMVYRMDWLTEGSWDPRCLIPSGSFLGHFFWVILLALNQCNFPLSSEQPTVVSSAYRIPQARAFWGPRLKSHVGCSFLHAKWAEKHLLNCWPHVVTQQYPSHGCFDFTASLPHEWVKRAAVHLTLSCFFVVVASLPWGQKSSTWTDPNRSVALLFSLWSLLFFSIAFQLA